MLDIATRLKDIRKDHNLSQEELARRLFVTRQTISCWENGVRVPTLNALEDISKIYGIDIHELLGKNIVVMKTKLNWFAILGLVVFNGILLGTAGTLIALVMFFFCILLDQ
ncbi:helix-turn-helix transcriptional regulator [Leuconostoc suionicum]|uniref:helix-turn-helix domain-containing protein n=1 Tax=Leuconostoc suionicum TaxID=1511761 RepID=UPI00300C4EA0